MNTGSVTSVMPGKPLVNGVRIIMSAARTPRSIIRRRLNLRRAGERMILRVKDPTLLTEPCI